MADRIIREADPQGRDLTEWRGLADRGEVETVHLSTSLKLTAATGVDREQSEHAVRGRNVGGILHGKGDLAEEWIAIGAHHDHVGDGSLGGINPRNRGQLHPGADDNASGTAGVLVLARMLSEAYDETPQDTDLRSVIFLTFDGEEMGLRGSRHFADHPSIPPESISILLNMDMIGRLRSRNLSVLGMATTGGLEESLRPIFEESGLTIAVNRSGSGRSDDASFHRINVPALHFFTGMHREYTSPRDQAYTVNPAGAGEILDLLYTVALTVAARPEKLVYREPPPSRGRDRAYAPVRLGIRPGMGDDIASGVLVDQVYEGTSAGEAGMKGGDVIIGWDDEVLEGVRDLFERLQEHEPGDRVQLTVLRDGEHVVLTVTFQASRPE